MIKKFAAILMMAVLTASAASGQTEGGTPGQPSVTVLDTLEVQGILGREIRSTADENMSLVMLAIARRRLELGRIALLPLLIPPLLCSLAVALAIVALPASAHQFWWLEVAVGTAVLGGCLLLFERRIAKAAWALTRRAR